jgi:hypothetical protein
MPRSPSELSKLVDQLRRLIQDLRLRVARIQRDIAVIKPEALKSDAAVADHALRGILSPGDVLIENAAGAPDGATPGTAGVALVSAGATATPVFSTIAAAGIATDAVRNSHISAQTIVGAHPTPSASKISPGSIDTADLKSGVIPTIDVAADGGIDKTGDTLSLNEGTPTSTLGGVLADGDGVYMSAATTSLAGALTGADKTRLDTKFVDDTWTSGFISFSISHITDTGGGTFADRGIGVSGATDDDGVLAVDNWTEANDEAGYWSFVADSSLDRTAAVSAKIFIKINSSVDTANMYLVMAGRAVAQGESPYSQGYLIGGNATTSLSGFSNGQLLNIDMASVIPANQLGEWDLVKGSIRRDGSHANDTTGANLQYVGVIFTGTKKKV